MATEHIPTERQVRNFWDKVDKTAGLGPYGDCWEWTGCTNSGNRSGGYGMTRYGARTMYTHRISLIMHKGQPPEGKPFALHGICNNRKCVNPEHLRWGTNKENMEDRSNFGAGSARKGIANGNAVINDDIVARILLDTAKTSEVSKRHGVPSHLVNRIRAGTVWRHVPRPEGYVAPVRYSAPRIYKLKSQTQGDV